MQTGELGPGQLAACWAGRPLACPPPGIYKQALQVQLTLCFRERLRMSFGRPIGCAKNPDKTNFEETLQSSGYCIVRRQAAHLMILA